MLAMTPAIVSRCRVFQFEALTKDHIKQAVLSAAANHERGFGDIPLEIAPDALDHIASVANGDARSALNALELAVLTTRPDADGITRITMDVAEESIQKRQMRCDESYFYDMLSAFCKSLRGSDSDAALAWAFRLLHAGADPRIIVRRMIAHASEDVGLANPNAMLQAVAAMHALEFVGLPEARLSITQAIIFICESPKSNAVVMALGAAADYLIKIGIERIMRHEKELTDYLMLGLSHIKGLRLVGTAEDKTSVVAFVLEGWHPPDIARFLDTRGVAIRAGHHCAMPVHERFNLPGTARASIGLYNTYEELDLLLESVRELSLN
jgi:replication-associated recombination protein RarA